MKQETSSPYLNARRVENDRTADIMGRCRLWQAVALLALLWAVGGMGGVLHLAASSQFVPYVVEVDRLGQTRGAGRADRAAEADERVVRHLLASFISDARTVSFDRNIQTEAVWRVYSALRQNDPATAKMSTYMTDVNTSPTRRAEKSSVSVEIVSVMKQSADTWEVIWLETEWRRDSGEALQARRWRALLNVYFLPPTSATAEEQIRRNPLGVFVKDFSWSAVLK